MNRFLALPAFLVNRFIKRGSPWTFSLTIFLIAIAFINLVFVTSLFQGIIDGANKQIINTISGHVMIRPPKGQDTFPDFRQTITLARGVPGVRSVASELTFPSSLEYKGIKGNWTTIAIDPEAERTVTNIADTIIEGSYLSADDVEGIVLGYQIAGGRGADMETFSFRGAQVGETVTLTVNGFRRDFTIRGIFNSKFINSDQRAFINRVAVEQMMPQLTNAATAILVRQESSGNEDKTIANLEAAGIEGEFTPWQEAAGIMKSITASFLSINVLMTLVGVLIAAVTIFIVVYIDIFNRRRQIGILRAIGLPVQVIRSTYVLQTLTYSVFGVALGLILFFAAIVPYFQAHPFRLPIVDATLQISPVDFPIRIAVIIIVALLSGLVPTIMITRENILTAIKGR
jgi:putative ABC transport system permease protein